MKNILRKILVLAMLITNIGQVLGCDDTNSTDPEPRSLLDFVATRAKEMLTASYLCSEAKTELAIQNTLNKASQMKSTQDCLRVDLFTQSRLQIPETWTVHAIYQDGKMAIIENGEGDLYKYNLLNGNSEFLGDINGSIDCACSTEDERSIVVGSTLYNEDEDDGLADIDHSRVTVIGPEQTIIKRINGKPIHKLTQYDNTSKIACAHNFGEITLFTGEDISKDYETGKRIESKDGVRATKLKFTPSGKHLVAAFGEEPTSNLFGSVEVFYTDKIKSFRYFDHEEMVTAFFC